MKQFTDHDIYLTPKKKISFIARIFPGLVFYPKMAHVVLRASRACKRGVYSEMLWIRDSLDIIRALESVGVKITIENLYILKKILPPCVFIGNHMSTLETFVLPSIIQSHMDVTFIIKKELTQYPVFKHIMTDRNPVIVTRKNAREDFKTVMEEGLKRLKNKISIIIFPQTTRRNLFDKKKFNTIGIKLAREAAVPVVPFAIRTDAWGVGKIIKDFGKIDPKKPVRISFGNPLSISGNGKREHLLVIEFISDKLRSWGIEVV